MTHSDKNLSQKLEGTEARASADLVETRARLMPESGATWIKVAGAHAMFDGVDSPITQTFGLGVFDDVTDEHLDSLETFFIERAAPVFHEVSPMANPTMLQLLGRRGYVPVELTTVMYRELEFGVPPSRAASRPNSELTTRMIGESEADLWAETAAAGWSTEQDGLSDFMLAFGKIAARARGGHPFLAELNGRPIAAAGCHIYNDVCLLAGAATRPEARRQGAQNALLHARLRYAAERKCRLAMVCASPGSQSQKNAETNGFKTAYTRTKWHLSL